MRHFTDCPQIEFPSSSFESSLSAYLWTLRAGIPATRRRALRAEINWKRSSIPRPNSRSFQEGTRFHREPRRFPGSPVHFRYFPIVPLRVPTIPHPGHRLWHPVKHVMHRNVHYFRVNTRPPPSARRSPVPTCPHRRQFSDNFVTIVSGSLYSIKGVRILCTPVPPPPIHHARFTPTPCARCG